MVLNMSYFIFGGDSEFLNQILKIPNLKFYNFSNSLWDSYDLWPPMHNPIPMCDSQKNDFHTRKTHTNSFIQACVAVEVFLRLEP